VTGESALRIAALLPEVLGTYADRGNVTVIAQRARWRGLEVEVLAVPADTVPPVDCDVYVIGGGEDVAQRFAAGWLRRHPRLCAAITGRATTLAICAGMQILGECMVDLGGQVTVGAGVLPLTTVAARRRAVGEAVVAAGPPVGEPLTGFENHRGRTVLGPGVQPLGRVLTGTGNGDGRRTEGVLTDTVVGTYLHGPVLARNPALADVLLERATGLRPAPLELPDQEAVRRLRLPAAGRGWNRVPGAGLLARRRSWLR
jgi:CobQ-like glutamine amidotransferase family enzyme